MEKDSGGNKIQRVLQLYVKLSEGSIVNKAEEAHHYGVNERSIQRDIDDIRSFLDLDASRSGEENNVVYDRFARGYRLETYRRSGLENGEILALCKILLDSRAFTQKRMSGMLDKLITSCVPKTDQKRIRALIRNEEYHYVELRHRTDLVDRIWELGQAISETRCIEVDYCRTVDKQIVHRKLQPVAVMFSEFYFYLTAFIDENGIQRKSGQLNSFSPTIYRLDRIRKLKVLDERFHIPYSDRFEAGEFRKRIQFMYGGELQRVTFKYSGPDIDAILDRLPTAEILEEDEGVFTVRAEVFGTGIDMWLRSQGVHVQVLKEEPR